MDLTKFGLSKDDLKQEISDTDIDNICRAYCTKWRNLYAHLGLERTFVVNAERDGYDEADKKAHFFRAWKGEEASDTTFGKLIDALMQIKCKQDAEGVCKLLAAKLGKQPIIIVEG